jgi:hypothetical protein
MKLFLSSRADATGMAARQGTNFRIGQRFEGLTDSRRACVGGSPQGGRPVRVAETEAR